MCTIIIVKMVAFRDPIFGFDGFLGYGSLFDLKLPGICVLSTSFIVFQY